MEAHRGRAVENEFSRVPQQYFNPLPKREKVSERSFVVLPEGEMIFGADEQKQVINCELDLDRIAEVR